MKLNFSVFVIALIAALKNIREYPSSSVFIFLTGTTVEPNISEDKKWSKTKRNVTETIASSLNLK